MISEDLIEKNIRSDSTNSPASSSRSTDSGEDQRRYKKYVQAVEKTLTTFDAVSEWADVIAFLGRLLKTFQAYQFQVVPKKLILTKRLAQCLNPALPTGVHQKTLEVYACIFDNIGKDELAKNLAIYSIGLFPFVQYAAMSVKPQLITLFENYFFPLRSRLKPALKSFIMALLPAIEEEGSEFFEKIVSLLDFLATNVETSYFYSCMWLVLITNANLRGPALNYLIRRMPKLTSKEGAAVTLGDDPSLMVCSFAATVGDSQLLVQRGILELLVQNFQLKNEIINSDDVILLMKHVIGVVLRKDMSLNRRLYAWLLGPDDNNEAQLAYFQTYGKPPLVAGLRSLFLLRVSDVTEVQKPYKMLISLMDKWEIGTPVVQELFVDILSSLKSHSDNMEYGPELLHTANMFIDMVEPYIIWSKLFGVIEAKAFMQNPAAASGHNTEALDLVDFVLSNFKMHDEEMQQMHLPLILLALLCKVDICTHNRDFLALIPQVERAFEIALVLLQQIPIEVFVTPPADHQILGSSTLMQTSDHEQHEDETTNHKDIESHQDNADDNPGKPTRVYFMDGMDALGYVQDFYQCRPGVSSAPDAVSNELTAIGGPVLVQELLKHIQNFLKEVLDQFIFTEKEEQKTGLEKTIKLACRLLAAITTFINKEECAGFGDERYYQFDKDWLRIMLVACHIVDNFGILDSILSTIVNLTKEKILLPKSAFNTMKQTKLVIDKLWSFLSFTTLPLHLRTVQLIWLVHEITSYHYVETVVAGYLIQSDTCERLSSFERFGVFWRLSEDNSQASLAFSRPMFLILDTLRDDNPSNRRAGETWVRCNLRSFIKVLDPLLLTLLNESIIRKSAELSLGEETIYFTVYERPFDQAQVLYVLETLMTVCRYGGLAFLRSMRMASIPAGGVVRELIDLINFKESELFNYAEVFVKVVLSYLETEVMNSLEISMASLNRSIQSLAADFIYFCVSKSEGIDSNIIANIHDSALRKMLYCIATSNLDLQTRLLHTLSTTLPIVMTGRIHSSGGGHINHRRLSSIDLPETSSLNPTSPRLYGHENTDKEVLRKAAASSLLIRTILASFSTPSNRPILQHWMDFVMSSLQYLRTYFKRILLPIMHCICEQLTKCRVDLAKTYSSSLAQGKTSITTSISTNAGDMLDVDVITFLTGLEKVIMLCLSDAKMIDEGSVETQINNAKPQSDAVKGFGLWLFSADSANETNLQEHKARDTILFQLPGILQILLNVWAVFRHSSEESEAVERSMNYNSDRVRARIKKMFERLHKSFLVEVVEAMVELFFADNPSAYNPMDTQDSQLDILTLEVIEAIPGCSTQSVIQTLLDGAEARTPGLNPTNRIKRSTIRLNKLSDTAIIRFLEIYCNRMVRPQLLAEAWNPCLTFVRDYFLNATAYKHIFPPLLRFLTVVLDKLSTTTILEDKKVRRDAQEAYQRVLDSCIMIAGRSFDQGTWLRRPTITEEGEVEPKPISEASTLAPPVAELASEDLTRSLSGTSIAELEKRSGWKIKEDVMISQINSYFITMVIRNLRRFLVDTDRISGVLTNLMYYVITPNLSLKSRSSSSKTQVILDLFIEMSKIPSSYRTWRKEVWEIFIDNRFFYMGPAAALKWKPILHVVMSTDKEKFGEILGRISTSPSTALFTNKDQESLNRALNLRRLSFVIFCGSMDQYISQLPNIQEKLVELLKLPYTELVHVEIYLCLRILLLRVSGKHLSSLWPVLLTEMMRLFEIYLNDQSSEKPEDTNIFLAACKFLDLICTIETEAFQIHQWIFITDTVEALNQSRGDGKSHALMDRLGGNLQHVESSFVESDYDRYLSFGSPSQGELKRPMLTMRSINSIRQLEFFASNVSLYVYQSTFTLAKPDMPFIEELVLSDLLDGDEGIDP